MFKRLFNRSQKDSLKLETVSGVWSLGIYTGSSPTCLKPFMERSNPVLTASNVTDVTANFVADPFMIHMDNLWHLFFEVEAVTPKGNIGKIGLAQSRDGFSWQYRKIVLEEPFHLSYPYVFEWEGDVYMIPETRADRTVRLYRAKNFPIQWEFVSILLKRRRFADSSIFRFDGRWWMFSDSGNTTLRLFYADALTGPWQEHKKSPLIKQNPEIARPGGRVIVTDDSVFRFAQDCKNGYGRQVWGFEISELSPRHYREKRLKNLIIGSSGEGWNRWGMHTVDSHILKDKTWIACVDGFGEPNDK